ncbi:serine/arginine repetitive matrix protein 3 [Drosophila ficusphila]|uniref:serine/arginine repetitive matrix protein 3 n=1 Tax=Drosophila ficusphila TaxID=30025 RepID=UPI0007E74E78|nr:serine/arginine repetitive matrix protein 3 [Drosophila ficusphila]
MAATVPISQAPKRQPEPKFPAAMRRGSGTVNSNPAVPKSPDALTSLVARKSITSMSEEEIIQENLNEILDLKSREERKANGRLVAVIVCFLVLFLAVYHACVRKSENSLAGVLVPAGIMLSYGAWVAVLAKRDKHRRAMFERHIEEVTLKNKIELEEKHARHAKHSQSHSNLGHSGTDSTGSASSTLHYVNELLPNGEHRKKQRRHRHKERPGDREDHHNRQSLEVGVHRGAPKRPSFRQKLFGQTIAHVKLVEAQSDSTDSAGGTGTGSNPVRSSGASSNPIRSTGAGSSPVRSTGANSNQSRSTAAKPASTGGDSSNAGERRQRLQRLDTLPLPQVVRVGSVP